MKRSGFSSKPVKVRKNLYSRQGPASSSANTRLYSSLSYDLKTKYTRNTVRVREGDSVKLVRGEYSGIEGKVQKVYPREGRVTIEGVTREKIAGGTTPIHIHASKVVVTSLNMDDKFRRQKLEGSK